MQNNSKEMEIEGLLEEQNRLSKENITLFSSFRLIKTLIDRHMVTIREHVPIQIEKAHHK